MYDLRKPKTLLILLALLLFITACSSVNPSSGSVGSSKPESTSTYAPSTSPSATTPALSTVPPASPQSVDDLDKFSIVNLNTTDNRKVILPLPENWRVSKFIYTVAQSFSFEQAKNKSIRSLYAYRLFNEKN